MKKIIAIALASLLVISGFSNQAFAANDITAFGKTETAILKKCGEEEGSTSITCIINLVIDILSIGVGIFGVIAISVVGIQYLTAGDNEEKVRTAKRRLLEIVIGIAVYVVAFSLLKFLLPSFESSGQSQIPPSPNSSQQITRAQLAK